MAKSKAQKAAEAKKKAEEKAQKEHDEKVEKSRDTVNKIIEKEQAAEKTETESKQAEAKEQAKDKGKPLTAAQKRKALLVARLKEQATNPKYPLAMADAWYKEVLEIQAGVWDPNKKRPKKRMTAQEMLDRITAGDN